MGWVARWMYRNGSWVRYWYRETLQPTRCDALSRGNRTCFGRLSLSRMPTHLVGIERHGAQAPNEIPAHCIPVTFTSSKYNSSQEHCNRMQSRSSKPSQLGLRAPVYYQPASLLG